MKTTSDIQNYFEDKVVFVTGATGFLGKLIVEKLLRTCDIKKLYITKRPIKNKRHFENVEEYFNQEIFDRLKRERNEALEKVAVVVADVTMSSLGMSEADRKLLKEEVNVVIHMAANVRFDSSLKIVAYTNVKGTEEILKLCRELKHLTSVAYVSTAFSNCGKLEVGDESFHDPPLKSHELLTMVEALDDETLKAITPSILGKWPNAYSFSKSIAENCIKNYHGKLPIVIIRPSVVVGTAFDPVPGWINNIMGVSGMLLGIGLGLIRTVHGNLENVSDVIPADYVVNCLLAAAVKIPQDGHIPVYNCVSSSRNPITSTELSKYGWDHWCQIPSVKLVWYKCLVAVSNKYLFYILHFLLHTVPAYVVDFFMWCLGKEPKCVKGYKKISEFLLLTSYFIKNQWIFDDTNTQNLWNSLKETDQALYPFDVAQLDWNNYLKSFVAGLRIYLLKDPLDTLPEGRKKIFRLKIAHYAVITVIALITLQIFKYLISFMVKRIY